MMRDLTGSTGRRDHPAQCLTHDGGDLRETQAAPDQTGYDRPSVCTSGALWKNKRQRMKKDVLVERWETGDGTGAVL